MSHSKRPIDCLEDAIRILDEIIIQRDDFYDLNLKYTGAKLDQKILMENGWAILEKIDGENIWLEKSFRYNDGEIVCRIFCSALVHIRYLRGINIDTDGGFLPYNPVIPDSVRVALVEDFESALLLAPATTIESEIENITYTYPSDILPKEWEESLKRFAIWDHELQRLGKLSPYNQYRLLFGVLRFGRFCDYGQIIANALITALNLKFDKGIALLTKLALTRDHESKRSHFWNTLGASLEYFNIKAHALQCYKKAWDIEPEPAYAKNIWQCGRSLLLARLHDGAWDQLLSIAGLVVAALPEDVDVNEHAEIYCIAGMYHEYHNDLEEAQQFYNTAANIYIKAKGDIEDKLELRWKFPLVYQSFIRCWVQDDVVRKTHFEAQLKTFPDVPQSVGFGGLIPVCYVTGDGHGAHWLTVVDNEIFENIEEFAGIMVREGERKTVGKELSGYDRGDGMFCYGVSLYYQASGDEDIPIESLALCGAQANAESLAFVSGYPIFKRGTGCKVIRKINELHVWSNALEATADFILTENIALSFFIPEYFNQLSTLKSDTAYEIELAGFAYDVTKFEEQSFDVTNPSMLAIEKERLRENGEDDDIQSVTVKFGFDFCTLTRAMNAGRDDISLIAPICEVSYFNFRGTPCCRLVVQFDERGGELRLPIYLRVGNLEAGYNPQVGDVISAGAWLQGIISETQADAPQVDFKKHPSLFDIWNDTLFLGTLDANHDLRKLVPKALAEKANATDIAPLPESLPGDPQFSCKINGDLCYIRAMTGYYNDEFSFQTEEQAFLENTERLGRFSPVHFVSIVGIAIKGRDEGYNIHYNGFDIST